MANLSRFIRDDLADLEPYDPNFCDTQVPLSANENPEDVPAAVRALINERLSHVAFNRYPDPVANELRQGIADMFGLGRDNVVVGNGGDELLLNLFIAFGGLGRTLVTHTPTFSVYALNAEMTGTTIVTIPRNADFSVDRAALLQAAPQADILIVCNPNNPTGDVIDREFIGELCAQTRGIVFIDEAYAEFADKNLSCVDMIHDHDNLLVLRTFSKAYSLAGVRIGYCLGDEAIINGLLAVRQPYSVDALSQVVAVAVVEGRKHFEAGISLLISQRELLQTKLRSLRVPGLEVWDSQANFIMVRLPHAHEVYKHMLDDSSVLVRDFSRSQGLTNCLRISVGSPDQNERLLLALTRAIETVGEYYENL